MPLPCLSGCHSRREPASRICPCRCACPKLTPNPTKPASSKSSPSTSSASASAKPSPSPGNALPPPSSRAHHLIRYTSLAMSDTLLDPPTPSLDDYPDLASFGTRQQFINRWSRAFSSSRSPFLSLSNYDFFQTQISGGPWHRSSLRFQACSLSVTPSTSVSGEASAAPSASNASAPATNAAPATSPDTAAPPSSSPTSPQTTSPHPQVN